MSEIPVTVPFVSFRPMERELDAELRGAFARVLDNSWYISGREDAAFEKAFAAYCGVRHCIGCGNGLDALVLILKAMGIGPGDEVIAPSNTFIATVLAISYAGATPVPAEGHARRICLQAAEPPAQRFTVIEEISRRKGQHPPGGDCTQGVLHVFHSAAVRHQLDGLHIGDAVGCKICAALGKIILR